ncbi:CaiB/BaiF CoA transferase family protein [Mycolicibacterium bacteremicum]|uniref:Carnitine dehydratase n=1 Tax=Mycolicibacterium bacteremicum TaxID=564198 RepID=A0A1W9YXB4_MYCBA|nr:CaiB/BaiF CoA-transferase family protein [Mycolicibacterium bacteremicum]MCV7431580.1 CoA transferase [Mycolicibacterium bacteremicum]ORA04410.1 carnitine dehydratase [Mycolicibacterium bacteremicum]
MVDNEAPLAGVRIIELAGIGPGPFAGMMLADLGADVITVDRPGGNPWAEGGHDVMFRSRRSIAVDLKNPGGAEVVKELCRDADGIIDTYRPGVAERLGIGPQDCLVVNPRLVYGRVTGWGQDGPMASLPGHDINYIALTGALHAIGRRGGPPTAPLNLVGDFGGGGMLMAFGMLAGILSARATGTGRVVDAAMIDGASALMAMFHALRGKGDFSADRGTHLLDSGAFFYDVYLTRDGQWVSIGAIETQFWHELCDILDLPDDMRRNQFDETRWEEFRTVLAGRIAMHDRAELDEMFDGRNTCYAPVLSLSEVADHPHNAARKTLIEVDGVQQAAPAPRFDGAPPTTPRPQRKPGQDSRDVLIEAGYSVADIDQLIESGAVSSL